MSFGKAGNCLPNQLLVDIEQKLTEEITRILRLEYEGISSPVKRIALKTGIAHETIRKWYKGKNTPRLAHIVMLARCYPAVLVLLLRLSGYEYLCAHVVSPEQMGEPLDMAASLPPAAGEDVPINVPINFWPDDLNERQVWFLTQLQRDEAVAAADLAGRWDVTDRTAKRDLADLKMRGLIGYTGATRTGKYKYTGD